MASPSNKQGTSVLPLHDCDNDFSFPCLENINGFSALSKPLSPQDCDSGNKQLKFNHISSSFVVWVVWRGLDTCTELSLGKMKDFPFNATGSLSSKITVFFTFTENTLSHTTGPCWFKLFQPIDACLFI